MYRERETQVEEEAKGFAQEGMRQGSYHYLFGPVRSRRLGRSLGIDIIPFKTCNFNCVYCECGETTSQTNERQSFFPPEDILVELKDFLASEVPTDYLTFSGSGEPLLNKDIGYLIRELKKLTDIPIAILTNGSLLVDEKVRGEILPADLVIPSLDAVSGETLRRINRPVSGITAQGIIEGLKKFRGEFKGQLWLEIVICKDINNDEGELKGLAALTREIGFDRIQLGTVVRPPAVPGVQPVSEELLKKMRPWFGENAELISAARPAPGVANSGRQGEEDILAYLSRRPATLEELTAALDIKKPILTRILRKLTSNGTLELRNHDEQDFYTLKK